MWEILNAVFFISNMSFLLFKSGKALVSLAETTSMAASVVGWKYTILASLFLFRLRLQQWWGENIEKIEEEKYVLSHVIRGQEVRVIVNLVSKENQPVKILAEEKSTSGTTFRRDITADALPFFRTRPEEVSPEFFFEDILITVGKDKKEKMIFSE